MFERHNNLLVVATFLVIVILYFISAYYSILYSLMNADEGYYAIATKYVVEGKIPYRDFAYPQTPILPYLNGIIMKIIGFGQIEQRIANLAWGGLALIVSMGIVLKRSNLFACAMCGWILTVPPYWCSWVANCSFATYGAANFFMVLACWSIISGLSYYKKVALFSVAGNLAIGCRLPVGPAVMILFAFLLIHGKNYKEKAIALISFSCICLILFGPFYWADKENFIFWNLIYHIKSSFNRRIVSEYIFMYPSAMLLILGGMLASLLEIRKRIISPEFVILFSAAIGILSQIFLKCSYGVYSSPFIAPGIIGSLIILSKFQWHKYLFLFFISFPLVYLTPFNPTTYLFHNMIQIDKKWNESVDTATDIIKKNVPKNEKILTPYTILAVQSDRPVFNGMEMGPFGITDEIEIDRAKRLHLTHYDTLIGLVENREPYAVVLPNFSSTHSFYWSMPSLLGVDENKRKKFFDQLLKNYQICYDKYQLAIFLRK
jgi:hypothetical protein